MPEATELPIDTDASAEEMAEAMFGNGIQIISATYSGADSASGIFSDGDSAAPGVTPSDTGVILSTGNATDVTNSSGDANTSSSTSTNHQLDGDSDLNEIAGATTYDAAIFEAEFVPLGSTLTMQITFSSEEYLEYVGSGFNDAVGVWVNGEQATLTIGEGDVTINNINDEENENLYIDNPADGESYNTEMDGFTVTLTLKAPVNPNEINNIKIGIADGGDGVYDSNLMIAGDSIQTALMAGDDEVEIVGREEQTLDVLANDTNTAGGELTVTAINGQPVSAGDTVTLATGEVVTLNDDGTFTIDSDSTTEQSNIFTYEVEDIDGNTDVGFVTVNTTPCFVAGTLIDTAMGKIRVEDLSPGDMVWTRDNGLQRLRWMGKTRRRASGNDAPIVFERGALGAHGAISLSPNHRVLLVAPMAELLFGDSEVLVSAKHLVNDHSIRRCSNGQPVTYVHLLFDRHQVIRGNGMESESYHPGDLSLASFDTETRQEVLALMPDLALSDYGYGPTARRVLRKYEACSLGQ